MNADELLEGKARAFVSVHAAAMLDLVASSTTVRPETTPETLLFDVHRLGFLQREFLLLVSASTKLVSAAHCLQDDAIVKRIGEEVLAPAKELDYERVLASVADILGNPEHSVLRVLTQCTSPADMVHKVMARRMRTLVGEVMRSGQPRVLHDTRFMQAAKPLFDRIEKLATKLMSLANLNRTVHLPTYNRLIGKAAIDHCRRPAVVHAGCAKRMK